jgi:hypothetical protein
MTKTLHDEFRAASAEGRVLPVRVREEAGSA